MDAIVSAINSVFTFAIGGIADVAETVTGTPILLFVAVCGVAFMGVTLFKRLLSVNM